MFILNNILLGIGLAMDAFSVSLANGLKEPHMRKRKMIGIAGVFAAFQIAMPLIGWLCVHTVVTYFKSFQKAVPWIALILLGYIGGKMLYEGISGETDGEAESLDQGALLVQGIATSIDALSVGFTIANYPALQALMASVIIGITTFIICLGGVHLGKIFGIRLSSKASILGGCILIFIGLEIFISHMI